LGEADTLALLCTQGNRGSAEHVARYEIKIGKCRLCGRQSDRRESHTELLARVDDTTQACDKAQAENGILKVYVDNLKKKYVVVIFGFSYLAVIHYN
jgi:hypothetical protein